VSILKPDITGKHSEKRKKQQPIKTQKNIKYRNVSYKRTQFLHLACQGGGSHSCPPVSYATGWWTSSGTPLISIMQVAASRGRWATVGLRAQMSFLFIQKVEYVEL